MKSWFIFVVIAILIFITGCAETSDNIIDENNKNVDIVEKDISEVNDLITKSDILIEQINKGIEIPVSEFQDIYKYFMNHN